MVPTRYHQIPFTEFPPSFQPCCCSPLWNYSIINPFWEIFPRQSSKNMIVDPLWHKVNRFLKKDMSMSRTDERRYSLAIPQYWKEEGNVGFWRAQTKETTQDSFRASRTWRITRRTYQLLFFRWRNSALTEIKKGLKDRKEKKQLNGSRTGCRVPRIWIDFPRKQNPDTTNRFQILLFGLMPYHSRLLLFSRNKCLTFCRKE